jgi:hypothetical protein
VREYAVKMDTLGFTGLMDRIPSNFFLAAGGGWMHPFLQAPAALRKYASELKKEYGRSLKVIPELNA